MAKRAAEPLSSMPAVFLERIRDVQPFVTGIETSPLKLLVDLSNQDKHRGMTTKQVAVLAAALQDVIPYGLLVRFCALAGLKAEVQGLRVNDVVLTGAAHIEVRQTIKRVGECGRSARRSPPGLLDQLHDGEFARAINGDIEIELALGGLDLGDIDVEIADRIGLEPLLGGLVALDLRQPRDAVTRQAAMQ